MPLNQRTVKSEIGCTGIGLHTGKKVTMVIKPLPPNSGIRCRTRRVKRWRDHAMVVRWAAASLLDMEKRFRKIMGHQQLWILDAKLKDLAAVEAVDQTTKVA